jgi:vacuolar protein sorting-associated protein 13A/C
MNYLEAGRNPTSFISSEVASSDDLVKVKYVRVQPESPEFTTVYESVNQSIEAAISTIVLRAQPEPVLAVYDFIMSTFVPEQQPAAPPPSNLSSNQLTVTIPPTTQPQSQPRSEQIKVQVTMQGVEGLYLVCTVNLYSPSFSYPDECGI